MCILMCLNKLMHLKARAREQFMCAWDCSLLNQAVVAPAGRWPRPGGVRGGSGVEGKVRVSLPAQGCCLPDQHAAERLWGAQGYFSVRLASGTVALLENFLLSQRRVLLFLCPVRSNIYIYIH